MATSTTTVVLNSWKEIASYLGRGVRTVQRYERESQLPVRRVQGKAHSSVLALGKDLDNWLDQTPLRGLDQLSVEDPGKWDVLQSTEGPSSGWSLACAYSVIASQKGGGFETASARSA